MTGAPIILGVTILIGLLLYLHDRHHYRSKDRNYPSRDEVEEAEEVNRDEEKEESSGECCGLHLICEKELKAMSANEILYYDDEELDRFAGREPEKYTAGEVEEFREILLTMQPQDTSGWARSLEARHIRLPQEVRDELMLILAEYRATIKK